MKQLTLAFFKSVNLRMPKEIYVIKIIYKPGLNTEIFPQLQVKNNTRA